MSGKRGKSTGGGDSRQPAVAGGAVSDQVVGWQESRSGARGWLPLMCSARSAFADTLARLMRLCLWFGGGCLGI